MQESFQRGVQKAKAELEQWESYFGKDSTYIVGSSFTLADMSLAMTLLFVSHYGAQLTGYPQLSEYVQRLKSEPAIEQTWPPHWRKSTAGSDWLTDL